MDEFPSIKRVKTVDLIPYARNSRTHSDEQVNQIASSIKEFGFLNPIIIDGDNGIIAGHGRVMAANKLHIKELPCVDASHLSETQRRAYVIADNKLALNSGWDIDMLRVEFDELQEAGFDLELTGFSMDEIADLQIEELTEGLTDEDAVPELDKIEPVSVRGDVWQLGHNRVMCGDSTMIDDIDKLTSGEKAQLLHADPPYGMGKEGDGVANDNLYNEDLDKFQMDWWSAFRSALVDNASAYIWGNAPDLWRLWYGGLGNSENMELRNEIVWDKKYIPGMASPGLTQYPTASERCLFFQLGSQFLGSVNADDFPDSWEPIRGYMEAEAKAAGVNPTEVKRVCGCGMYPHWFTKSHFTLIPEKHYAALAAEYPGHFARPWRELKAEWDKVKDVLTRQVQGARSHFDNAHEPMRDVWELKKESRNDYHPTQKPVELPERAVGNSSKQGDLILDLFGGSGSTLIACEKTGRNAYLMELDPKYIDVIITRWQNFTGKEAVHIESGKTFCELKAERANA